MPFIEVKAKRNRYASNSLSCDDDFGYCSVVTQVFRYKRQANYALERFADALWDATNKLKLVQPESEYEDGFQRSADLRPSELQRLYNNILCIKTLPTLML